MIAVIGLSPGVVALAKEAQALIAEADVLAGGKRQLACFESSNAERIVLAADVKASIPALRQAIAEDRRVVVLASGDPLLYGIGATLVRELGREHVRILPSVSSVQAAFARTGEAWHDAAILSAHGRPLAEIVPAALGAIKLAVLTDDDATPAQIARALIEAGMENCVAMVCERLGEAEERVTQTTLYELGGQQFDRLNVLLLFRQAADVRLRFGQADVEFESVHGQITKAEVRAVALSKLRLAPSGVLWDIGAGSGAIAIEAARLMPRGTVFAIERDADQLACLRRNLTHHRANNVRVVAGEAPNALAGLPAPHSVFIGGSGGRLAQLLDAVSRPFVANLSILEHMTLVLARFPASEVTHLSVARSSAIADGHRLAGLNPVYIVSVPA